MNAEDRSQLYQTLFDRRHAITDDWHKAIARTSFVPFKAAEARQHLVESTEQAITLLLTEPFDRAQAEAIGASLANLHYVEPEALGRTQEVLARQLVEGLPAEQVVELQPCLAALLGEVATGFLRQARETALAEQEWIHGALIRELQRVDEALRKAYDEVEQRVQERTAELRATNESLQNEIAERKRAEVAKRESEERYRLLAENTTDVIWLMDMNLRFTYVSPSVTGMLGYSMEEVATQGLEAVLTPASLEAAKEVFAEALQAVEPQDLYEFELHHKNGSTVVTESKVAFLRDPYGQPVFIMGVTRDITEHKRTDEKIRHRNRELTALNVIASTANLSLHLKEVLDISMEKILDIVGASMGCVLLIEHPSRTLSVWGARGLPPKLAEQLETTVLDGDYWQEEAFDVTELWHISESVKDVIRNTGLTPGILLPLRWENAALGIILLMGHRDDTLAQWSIEFLVTVSDQLSLAVKNAALYQEAQRELAERRRAEEALRISVQQWHATFDAITDTICLLDWEGRILRCNRAMARLLEKPFSEIVGHTCWELVYGTSEPIEGHPVVRMQETLRRETIVLQRGDRWFSVSVDPVLDEDGNLAGAVHTMADITARKRAEKALRVSEERYRSLFEGVPVGLFRIGSDGEFLDANPTMVNMLGYRDKESLMAVPSVDLQLDVAEEDRQARQVVLETDGTMRDVEVQLRRYDGGIIWAKTNFRAVRDADGQVLYYEGSVEDITERKRAQEALRESEERFRGIFENATIGLYRTTPDGRILMANPALVRMLGYLSFDELAQRNLVKEGYEPGYPRSAFKQRMESEGQVFGLESAWVRHDGITLFIRESARAVRDEAGNTLYYEGTVEDITERKLAQDALRKAHDELETRVQERTAELAQANEALQAEIIERRRAEEAMRRERDLAEALAEAAAVVSSTLDLDQVLDHILEQVSRVVPSDASNIMLMEDSRVHMARWRGYERFGAKQFVSSLVFHVPEMSTLQQMKDSRKSKVIPDIATFPDWVHVAEMEWLRSYAAAPIVVRDQVVGFLNVDSATPGFFTQGHADTLRAFADHAATALQNAQLYKEVKQELAERKRAEEELRDREETMRALLNAPIEVVALMDANGIFLDANEAAAKSVGKSIDELIGSCLDDVFPPEVAKSRKAQIDRAFRSGCPVRFEDEREGRSFDHNLYPIFDAQGKVARIAVFVRDTTQRKKAEEGLLSYQERLRSMASQLSLTEEKERQRIATALHDHVGQTLAICKIKLGALRRSASSTELAEPLDEIHSYIEEIIQDTRSLTFELSSPILYQLGLEAALEWLTEKIQERHGIPSRFRDDRQPKPLDDDVQVLLFQAVRELLLNVVKHAQAGSVKVSARRDGGNIHITVEDDGIGFDALPITSYSEIKGFGLFSIRERLDHIGGQFKIESQPGHGTRVTLVARLKRDKTNNEEEMI